MVRPDRTLAAKWDQVQPSLPMLIGLLLGAAILLVASGACSDSDAGGENVAFGGTAIAGDSAAAQRGERLYRAECVSCHGDSGDRLPIAPLNSVSFLNSRGDATLLAVVADGKGTMPAFGAARGGPFDQDEVTAVVAFLNALAGRSSTTLLAAEGATLYEQSCSSCHGPSGDRIPIAPLDAQGFLDTLTDARVREIILNGSGSMDGLGGTGRNALSERDATAIASFLRNRVQEQTAVSVGRGRDLYVGNCLSCHGTSGNGVSAVELSSGAFLTQLGDGRIISAITRGTDSGPAFGTEAGGAFAVPDTAALISYLKTWAGLNATAALSLGASGAGGQGEALFVQNCAPCHGTTGDGVAGVQLKDESFLTFKGQDVITNTIVVGNELGMPAWGEEAGGPLSAEQIAAIVDYLYSSAGLEAGPTGSGDTGGGDAGNAEDDPIFDGATAAEFFGANCAACHGADRSGGIGPALLPDVLTEADDFYETTILEGRSGTAMPAWTDQGVTPEQAAALVDFLKAVEEESGDSDPDSDADGTSAADDPIFDGATAAEFFGSNCAACHGADRSGGIGPALLSDVLTEADDFYASTILEGRPGTAMPAWADQGVTPEQADAMVAFLKRAADDGSEEGDGDAASAADTALFEGATVAEFFGSKCAGCHGADRSGGVGPALLPDRLTEFDDFYESTILDGRPGTAMPAWADQGVTPEQAAALVEFLKADPSESASASATATSSLIGTVPRDGLLGRELYENTCQLCHGADGLSIEACPIGSEQWQFNTSFEGFFARIANGKPSQGMPTWSEQFGGPLSDQQIISVIQYLGELAVN